MGKAYAFICKNCCYEYDISIGLGFGALTVPHNELYVCERCDKWKVVEFPPLIFSEERQGQESFRAYAEKEIKRDQCGLDMAETGEADLSSLPCPKCGTSNEATEISMWD